MMLLAERVSTAEDSFQLGLDAYLAGDYGLARSAWQPLAEAGDVVAAFNVGILHAQGLGVDKDPSEAFRWYQLAADAGYAPAQFNLGAAYREGAGVERDMTQAAHWWRKAAAQDHPRATFNLATLYLHGNGVAPDSNKAQSLYQKAADLGDPRAPQILAKFKDRESESADPAPIASRQAEARPSPEPERAAVAASAHSRTPSGQTGAPPAASSAPVQPSSDVTTPVKNDDWVSAQNREHLTIQLFAFAEEQAAVAFIRDHALEDHAAYFRAASRGRVWYKAVYGVYPDMASARAAQAQLPSELQANSPWIRRFSAIHSEMRSPQSNQSATGSTPRTALAVHRIPAGNMAERAKGQSAFNKQDYEQAFRVWKPLAERGDPEAQYSLGFMHESGWGTQKDYHKAYDWYRRAADQGHPKAQYNLGLLYFRGLGVDQDKGLAYYWIQNAADQQDPRAREFLLEGN